MTKPIPPGASTEFDALPANTKERHEALVDLFGQYILWMRQSRNELVRSRVDSAEARQQLGSIFRRCYEDVANLSEDEREKAIRLAETAVDGFIEFLLSVLAHRGFDFPLGKEHVVRFRLVAEVIERDSDQIVHEEVINRGGQKYFADYWGRWLNRFSEPKPSKS